MWQNIKSLVLEWKDFKKELLLRFDSEGIMVLLGADASKYHHLRAILFHLRLPKSKPSKGQCLQKGLKTSETLGGDCSRTHGTLPQIVVAEVWHLDRYWLVNWVGWSLCYPRGNCILYTSRPSSWSLQPLWLSRCLLSDNGAQFDSGQWKGTLEERGIEHWMTPIYHPQANPTKSWNHALKRLLRVLHLLNDKWDQHLDEILFH